SRFPRLENDVELLPQPLPEGGLFIFRLQPRGLGLLTLHVGLLRRQLGPLGLLLGGLLLRERRLTRRIGFGSRPIRRGPLLGRPRRRDLSLAFGVLRGETLGLG